MVNWSDPNEIAKDSDVFQKLIFALFGVYLWELFMTCDFEWSLISRRRKFRWPLCVDNHFTLYASRTFILSAVFFFFCRYCMLFAFIGLIISLNVTTPINCRALYTFNSWTGNMTILSASTSLMLRTIALWERQRTVIIALGALCLAHWALLYRTMFIVIAAWDDTLRACVVTATNPSLLNTTFFFTMGFDLIILVFTAVALLKKHSARTDLWKLLFQDGLVFFLVSFSTNCIPAVLNVLNLNTPMNVIATIPAATITSIAACRAVIRLLEFSSGDVYVHSMSAITSTHPIRHSIAPYSLPKSPNYVVKRPEVHVTTEHITMAEFPPSGANSPYSKSHCHRTSSVDLQSARDTEAHSENDDKESFVFPQTV
ncbi:hypothetical protein Hypma_009572 [Hypsizygus marmoreus]|uniref:Uncharacterized protein n=1 Tax=Hypsizygus marmoreus TaxID=39966 RepID=A0A369JSE4_HYPMA|nr:hypothetical protein Hypma_009572 [Hypsizygus marmoreus]